MRFTEIKQWPKKFLHILKCIYIQNTKTHCYSINKLRQSRGKSALSYMMSPPEWNTTHQWGKDRYNKYWEKKTHKVATKSVIILEKTGRLQQKHQWLFLRWDTAGTRWGTEQKDDPFLVTPLSSRWSAGQKQQRTCEKTKNTPSDKGRKRHDPKSRIFKEELQSLVKGKKKVRASQLSSRSNWPQKPPSVRITGKGKDNQCFLKSQGSLGEAALWVCPG